MKGSMETSYLIYLCTVYHSSTLFAYVLVTVSSYNVVIYNRHHNLCLHSDICFYPSHNYCLLANDSFTESTIQTNCTLERGDVGRRKQELSLNSVTILKERYSWNIAKKYYLCVYISLNMCKCHWLCLKLLCP